jgi:hypothetical protein
MKGLPYLISMFWLVLGVLWGVLEGPDLFWSTCMILGTLWVLVGNTEGRKR